MDKNKILSDAFMWLFIGLLACFGISYLTTTSEEMIYAVYGAFSGYGYIVYLIIEIVAALALTIFIKKLSPFMAKFLYLLYAGLTGLSLSGIFVVYSIGSLTFVFLATALIFGAFAIIGKTTKIDLSKWGIYLFVALLAIIILEIINIFIANHTLNMALCIISIVIFAAYVAYDIQFALNKAMYMNTDNAAIYCAFQLFLDFINLFIKLLRLFGKRRD